MRNTTLHSTRQVPMGEASVRHVCIITIPTKSVPPKRCLPFYKSSSDASDSPLQLRLYDLTLARQNNNSYDPVPRA